MGQYGRRRFLAEVSAGTAAIAGCLDIGGNTEGSDGVKPTDWEYEGDGYAVDVPTQSATVPLADDLDAFVENAESGGVRRDGIPSIDGPSFDDATYGDEILDDGDPVFGIVVNGDARAYAQHILVRHEIVNDTIGNEAVAVTYCPLTGTVLAFERGATTFGVSGRLVNSNLIMYDRATGSWWPQVLGTAVSGTLRGEALREVPIVWTAWESWRDRYPGTDVLTERTGYARNYNEDPYGGGYNPTRGFYGSGLVLFDVMYESDRLETKDVVVGARSRDGAVAAEKERLLEEAVVEISLDGVPYVAVADPTLETGYVYRNDGEADLQRDGDRYLVGGNRFDADGLPFDRLKTFEAMWFAWHAFYPNADVHT